MDFSAPVKLPVHLAFGFRGQKWNCRISAPVPNQPVIVVDGKTIDSVDNFIYLGSVLSSDDYSRPDINRHIGLASSAMSALSHIWKDRRLSLITKICIYQALVLFVLHCTQQNLDSSQCRFQSPRGIPYEMSEAAPAKQMSPVHSEQRQYWVHRSAINLRVNQPSLQLSFRSRR